MFGSLRVEPIHPFESGEFYRLGNDRSSVRALAKAAGAKLVDGPFLDFLDP